MVLDGVRKRYGRGPWVLDGIDLSVAPGSVSLVVGANGSGKSTLLRIMAGLSRVSSGEVRDRPASVAFAPERLAAQVRLTAGGYVAHMGRMRGLPAPSVAERSMELFGRLGLSPGPDMAVRSLSKGNKQKVVLTQAFLAPVDLMVLDEPFAGLDPVARSAAWELIADSCARGARVIVSAHGADDAVRADRCLTLAGGRLRALSATGPWPGRMQIRLAGTGDVSLLARLPGVVVHSAHSGPPGVALDPANPGPVGRVVEAVTLTVEGAFADRTLARALDQGWSVRSVTPVPPAEAVP